MKITELREKSADELLVELEEQREALFNLRFQKAKRNLTNTHAIRKVKKDIARIHTLLNEYQKD